MKRVVYTSSNAAVFYNDKDVDMMDETFWSDVDYIRKLDSWGKSYAISKTLTERAALEFAEEHGLDLVTLIPSLVVGPFICPKFAGSVRSSLALILGNVKLKMCCVMNRSHTLIICVCYCLCFRF